MASIMIHMAVAKKLNKDLKKDEYKFMLGSISPDISKLVGENKLRSHFLDSVDNNVPNMDKFLNKYKKDLNDDYILGYYVHLYTDYLWWKYFIPEIFDKNKSIITKLDGSKVDCHGRMAIQYIYNDFTNLNIRLIEDYDLNLEMFYEEIKPLDKTIDEIPCDRLNILIEESIKILNRARLDKEFVFNMDSVNNFIDLSVKLIKSNLIELKLLEE